MQRRNKFRKNAFNYSKTEKYAKYYFKLFRVYVCEALWHLAFSADSKICIMIILCCDICPKMIKIIFIYFIYREIVILACILYGMFHIPNIMLILKTTQRWKRKRTIMKLHEKIMQKIYKSQRNFTDAHIQMVERTALEVCTTFSCPERTNFAKNLHFKCKEKKSHKQIEKEMSLVTWNGDV